MAAELSHNCINYSADSESISKRLNRVQPFNFVGMEEMVHKYKPCLTTLVEPIKKKTETVRQQLLLTTDALTLFLFK